MGAVRRSLRAFVVLRAANTHVACRIAIRMTRVARALIIGRARRNAAVQDRITDDAGRSTIARRNTLDADAVWRAIGQIHGTLGVTETRCAGVRVKVAITRTRRRTIGVAQALDTAPDVRLAVLSGRGTLGRRLATGVQGAATPRSALRTRVGRAAAQIDRRVAAGRAGAAAAIGALRRGLRLQTRGARQQKTGPQ